MPKVVMLRQKGDFRRTSDFLKRANRLNLDVILNQYGQEGVEALRAATPKDTGTTANSWSYAVHKGDRLYHHNMVELKHCGRCAHCGNSAIRTWHPKRRVCAGNRLYQSGDEADFR